jgi:hypothetical protein
MLTKPEIAIAAQVWVCDACGSQTPKTCGCKSTAHMEKLAARAERNRQLNRAAAQKYRDKSKGRHDDAASISAGEVQRANAALDAHAASSEAAEAFKKLAAMPETKRPDRRDGLPPEERMAFQARRRFRELIDNLIFVRETQLIGEDRAGEQLRMAREVLAKLEGRHDLEKVREMMNFIEAAWPKPAVVRAFERSTNEEPPDGAIH